jgi:6-phosphogluconate dehydrogenase
MRFGIVGLGRIGGGLALQALEKGHEVVGLDVAGVSSDLLKAGLVEAKSLAELCSKLGEPKVIFLYIHAGEAIDQVLNELGPHLNKDDIVIDGGNSYWGDSKSRASRLKCRFLDLGTSGGLRGARNGACFMCGGERAAYDHIEPLLIDLAVNGGVVYCGPSGCGHFVKLVHNGIEFGMLQAIGEGIDLLEQFPEDLPIENVVGCWRNGSVIRSWLVELMHEALQKEPKLNDVPGYIDDTGEVNWLVSDAMEMEVPIPVISQSVMQLFASRDDRRAWARAIAMMRHGFGGHPYGPDRAVASDRKQSRIKP